MHSCRLFVSPWEGVYYTDMESTRQYGKHSHATYGLGVIQRGAHKSLSARGHVEAYAGDVIATNPGEVHDGRPLGGPSRRWRIVYFDPGALASLCGPAPSRSACMEITSAVIKDRELRRALLRLFCALEDWNSRQGADAAEILECEESAIETFGLLRQGHASSAAEGEVAADLRRVHQRLADDPLNPPTLSELARLAELSKYQVLRRFRKTYGLSPYAWLLQHRAEQARRSIAGGHTLASAAAAAGFADQSHMTRVFHRHFGFTPGAWRRVQ
jgi:AraC-like DNA-binding protein